MAVASGVDEDSAATVSLAEFLRDVIRVAAYQNGTNAMGETETSPKPSFASSGTTMWYPLDPDVFTQLARPSSRRRSRSASAAQDSVLVLRRVEVEDANVRVVHPGPPGNPHARSDAVLIDEPQ